MTTAARFRLGDLEFAWDPEKARSNVERHGVSFEEAATTWLDPLAIERRDVTHSADEERWLRIGTSLRGALLVVWSTERGEERRPVIRIIGARRANRKELELHES
ncbi:MAG TPA: BrnT family toxin [Gemmatimonadota bacterium]|nr:BrnT family toxin [Gemmatimonadota bacterium]